jgi:hypothetical protein
MSEILKNFWNCIQKVWTFENFFDYCQIRKLATDEVLKMEIITHQVIIKNDLWISWMWFFPPVQI